MEGKFSFIERGGYLELGLAAARLSLQKVLATSQSFGNLMSQ